MSSCGIFVSSLFASEESKLQAVKDAHYVLSNDILRDKYNERGYAALGPQFAKYAVLGEFFLLTYGVNCCCNYV